MPGSFIPDALAISLLIIALFISIRAFYLYGQSLSPRLFILGLAMAVIALTALADFASSHITSVNLNTDWFLYIGQSVSFLFILLSFFNTSDTYLRNLMRIHVVFAVLTLVLLVFSPTLPAFPNVLTQALLSGSRCVLCFAIFFNYMWAFMTKQTRFGGLMSLAFLLLSFGYLVILQKYIATDQTLLDNIGDIVRMGGLVALLAAVIKG